MKKQLGKKFSLRKETLRNLSEREMTAAAGGFCSKAECNASDATFTCGFCCTQVNTQCDC